MKSFLSRFGALVSFVLSGFDRLRFRGASRLLNNARGVDSYLFQQQIRYTDFPEHAERLTQRLRRETEAYAEQAGVPLQPLNSPEIDKEAVALQLAHQHQRTAGAIAVRPLNPLTGSDGTLLRVLGQGDYLVNGFRNRDVRAALHGANATDAERRRQSAAVTRQLALLRAHGVIVKVATTHRYHLSASGRRIVTALLAAHASDVSRLADSA